MCGWQRLGDPSSLRKSAILKRRRKLRCQLPTTDFGEPLPDQKKYRGLGLGPGGIFLNASATSGGSGTKTGLPVFARYRNNSPCSFNRRRSKVTASLIANPLQRMSKVRIRSRV